MPGSYSLEHRGQKGEKVKRSLSRARSLLPSFAPAMAAGLTDKLLGIGDIVKVLED